MYGRCIVVVSGTECHTRTDQGGRAAHVCNGSQWKPPVSQWPPKMLARALLSNKWRYGGEKVGAKLVSCGFADNLLRTRRHVPITVVSVVVMLAWADGRRPWKAAVFPINRLFPRRQVCKHGKTAKSA